MNEKYQNQLEALAELLVTPERYGKPLVAEVVQLFPLQTELPFDAA